MTTNLRLRALGFTLAAILCTLGATAQSSDPITAIQDKLQSSFRLTKITDDRSDIVKAGDIIEFHKGGMIMCSTPSEAASNTYKDGAITQGMLGGKGGSILHGVLHGKTVEESACPHRKFVDGEKCWVTSVTVREDGAIFRLYSDAYGDTRYYGDLRFPFQKHFIPTVDQIVNTVSEVITVQGGDNQDQAQSQKPASHQNAKQPPASKPDPAPAPAPPAAPMPDIPPPPPPPDAAPPTVEIGQTKDQVVAGFGQPQKILKPAAGKEIYVYKDMKVTFINGKVSRIE